ncbi:hypothetical protein E0L36_09970 [Streptomyces sp. AJS327]|uniref:hypothetical protein n=1 Tax=Streptomyces sp. AJS327 TaxID=2545265 RepID=UPI0015DFF25A|nr:hypothetical protein [Streptomyces sp. AJS327]MBA0051209.1 hypothetical protein [Streptomyces sp. AJS327]
MTSHGDVTDEYNRRAGTDPQLRGCVRDLDMTESAAYYADAGIARPMFAPLREIRNLTDDIRATIAVMDDLPNRCFGGSLESYLSAQGYDDELLSAMLAGIVGSGTPAGPWNSAADIGHGRADVFRGPDGCRVLELNMGSALGGRLTTTLNSALLRSPVFRGFAEEFGLSWIDPVRVLVDDLLAVGRTTIGTDAPVVAIVDESGTDDSCVRLMPELRARGVNALHGEFGELDVVGGKGRLRGEPVDIVLRFFFVRHIPHEPGGMDTLRALTEAHRAGRTALFTPFDPEIHGGKAALGLLFEPEVRARLAAAEIARVDRIIPWTRLVGPGFPTVEPAARAELLEECRARRTDLVLKPANLYASQGVVFGDEVGDAEWRALLATPPRPDYVVQERVRPRAEAVIDPKTAEPEDWTVLWQVFFGPAGYGGSSVRGRPRSQPGAVGGNDVTRTGCAFVH